MKMNTKMKKILLVDDDTAILDMMERILEETGKYEVRTEDDPRKAKPTALVFGPDLMVLDVDMPGMDGGDVAAQMKNDIVLGKVPIIFLTSLLTKEEEAAQKSRSGTQYMVSKPVSPAALIAHIEKRLTET
jgi:CheY-like chemotaxis protein